MVVSKTQLQGITALSGSGSLECIHFHQGICVPRHLPSRC